QGHIRAGGVDKDVSFIFIDATDEVNGQIDAAYRAKYRRCSQSIINTVLTPRRTFIDDPTRAGLDRSVFDCFARYARSARIAR
ncbi:MAG TPA: DUF2255 family protein, partial [Propionibacteriaceae bacterium]|nr:DUF2255 family protein [Propionibacteriaceae bacterium]